MPKKELGPIQLGDRVQYRVNGFTGIAVQKISHLTSCNQWFIASEEQKVGKKEQCEIIDDAIAVKLADDPKGLRKTYLSTKRPLPSGSPQLGDRVEDVVTGATGLVVVICESITGIHRYLVKPETKSAANAEESGEKYYEGAYLKVVKKDPKGLGKERLSRLEPTPAGKPKTDPGGMTIPFLGR